MVSPGQKEIITSSDLPATLFKIPQDATDLLGHEGTLLVHFQPIVHQNTFVLTVQNPLSQLLRWC